MTTSSPRSIAVVPAFNAGRSVGAVVSGLFGCWPEVGAAPSVIVVDDGSTDDTAAAARAAGALVIEHGKNLGKGAALRTGFARAAAMGAAAVVTVDADGQHPPEEAARIAAHPAPPTSLILGVRDLARDGAPRPNRFSNGISNFFLSVFTGRRLRDTQCGLRRYPIPGILRLGAVDAGYAFEAEVILRATHASWQIVEVPVRVHYPPADERVTHFHAVRDPARIVRRVLVTLATARSSE